MAIGFFAVRRASEIAQLATGDVSMDREKGFADIRETLKKNGQPGVGQQLALLVTIPTWVEARPGGIISARPGGLTRLS